MIFLFLPLFLFCFGFIFSKVLFKEQSLIRKETTVFSHYLHHLTVFSVLSHLSSIKLEHFCRCNAKTTTFKILYILNPLKIYSEIFLFL